MKKYFETIKCEDYEVFNLKYHEKRIADTIGLNLNLQDYIYPSSSKLLRCKLIYDKTGILEVNFSPYIKKNIKSFKLVFDDNIEYSKKYLNRETIDNLSLQKEYSDEIIIVKNGLITDTSIANIAIFLDESWLTPKAPLLTGTTRRRFLEKKNIIEKDIDINMLKETKQIALMNAMINFDIIEDYSLSL